MNSIQTPTPLSLLLSTTLPHTTTDTPFQKSHRLEHNLIELQRKSQHLQSFITRKSLATKIIHKDAKSLIALVYLPSGIPLAVKRISIQNIQQKNILEETKSQRILQCYGSLQDSQHVYLLTEFCPGGDLRNKIQREGSIKESRIKVLLKQIIEGLGYLHDRGIVHRDIKASNVFIKGKDVVLGDFGCCQKQASIQNREIQFKGSVLWMAPEVLRQQRVTTKSDIWSLGWLIVEMVLGQLPWAQNKFQNQITAIYNIGVLRLSPIISGNISVDLRKVLDSCLQLEWEKRPSCSELLRFKYFN